MLFEIPATDSRLLALFDPETTNHPMLFATLLGHTPGRAFVDDANNPMQCLLRTHGALIFLSQHATQNFLEDGLAHIKQFSYLALVWQSATAKLHIASADRTILRLAFAQCTASHEALSILKNSLPDGFTLRPIDKDLIARCEWREEIESFCGTTENFLAHGFGICLMQGDEIISEAYAPFVGTNQIEIGSVTKDKQRGHGYASITCAALILLCREQGSEPYWSCDADNLASAKLARKLGFQQEHPYEIELYRGAAQ